MSKQFSIFFIFFLSISVSCFADEADLYPVSMNEKIGNSEIIIRGTITGQNSYWDTPGGMIYTNNTLEIQSTYKGSPTSQTIQIRTVGGRVGNDMVTTSSLLTLELGDMGIFFLNPITGSSKYDVFSSKQGFLNFTYDRAVCPFTDLDVNACIGQILSTQQNNTAIAPYIPPVFPTTNLISNVSFSPSVITAGTNSILEIHGVGFGTGGPDLLNYISFSDANNGGAPAFYQVDLGNYVSWTDTLIKLIVPTRAGTGPVQITLAGISDNTSQELTVPFAILNVGGNNIPQHINSNGTGGLTFRFNANMNFAGGAADPFNRALATWKCATGVNWEVSPTTTVFDDPVAGDGVNVVARNTIANGALGVCYNYMSSCNGNDWILYSQDIIFKSSFLGLGSWNYSISAPPSGYYDFESVALHELGHAQILGHVVEPNNVMHYAIASGVMHRTLSLNNITAATWVMNESITTDPCGVLPMTLDFPVGCSVASLTDVWVAPSSIPLTDNTCQGLTDVQLSFLNLGFDTVTTVNFKWTVNGAPQPPFIWNGSASFNQLVDSISIGSFNFTNSFYEVVIWCDTVNGSIEMNQNNDTLMYQFTGDLCMPDNASIAGASPQAADTCFTTVDVSVDLYNDGSNNLTSCWIMIDDLVGGLDSLYWTGTILPNDTLNDIPLGNFGSPYPSLTRMFYSKWPNGVADTYPIDDTLHYELIPNRLVGTYTIGGIDPDFILLEDAIDQLNDYGICGDVIFNLRPGIYEGTFQIDDYPMDDPNYSVTFQSETLDSADVTIRHIVVIPFITTAMIGIAGSKNLTFQHLTFDRNLIDQGWGSYTFWIGLDAENITINSCHFEHSVNPQLVRNIYIQSARQNGNYVKNITIENNVFEEASYTVHTEAYQIDTLAGQGLRIHNNRISTQYDEALYLRDMVGIEVSNNEFHLTESVSWSITAIDYLHYGTDTVNVHHNYFSNKGNAYVCKFESVNTSDSISILFKNNSLSHVDRGYGNSSSIELRDVRNVDMVNNSLYSKMTGANAGISRIIDHFVLDTFILQNNNIVFDGNGYFMSYDNANSLNILNSDYNNFFNYGSFSNEAGGSTYSSTLAEHQLATGLDSNSFFINPIFATDTLLIPTNFDSLDNKGIPWVGITDDILGSSRDLVTPDIGCYEFDHPDYELAMLDYSNITDTTFCNGSSADVYVEMYNNGALVIDSFEVYVSIDQVPIDTVVIHHTIASLTSEIVLVGNYTFSGVSPELNLSSDLPNGVLDLIPTNNSQDFTVYTMLNGTYSVGDTTADFETIQDALFNLHQGLCGPVVFNLKDGNHHNWGTIGNIPNNNAINTITFQSEALDTGHVFIGTDYNNNFNLDNVQHVTFKYLDFGIFAGNNSGLVDIDSAVNTVFDSCDFGPNSFIRTSDTYEIVDGFTITNSNFYDANIEVGHSTNVLIDNNRFTGPYTYVRVYSGSTQLLPGNAKITNNYFNIDHPSYEAIYLTTCINCEISGNDINTNGRGIKLFSCDSTAIVMNNFVKSGTNAMRVGYCDGSKIYNNSFYSTRGFHFIGNTSLEFKNNIVQIDPSERMFENSSISIAGIESNHNIFYGGNQNEFMYDYNNFFAISYTNWLGSHLKDQNSQYGDPSFLSPTDLHTASVLAESAGVPFLDVPIDIDGDVRNLTNPDIGADEFISVGYVVYDVQLDSISHPINNNCAAEDTIKAIFTNNLNTTLTSADIEWNVNGIIGTPVNWTGSLAPGQSTEIIVGDYPFIQGVSYEIFVEVMNPNGNADVVSWNNYLTSSYSIYEYVQITGLNGMCPGDSTLLQSSVLNTSQDLLWSTGDTSNYINVGSGGVIWVSASNGLGCTSTDSITIQLFPQPVQVLIDDSDTTFCTTESVILSATPIVIGDSYAWSWTGTDTSSIDVYIAGIVTLAVTNSDGCVVYDTIQVVESTPSSSFTTTNDTIFQSTILNATSYQWNFNGVPIPGATSDNYIATQNGVYTLLTIDSAGCEATSNTHTVYTLNVSLQELDENAFLIVPNPTSGMIQIVFSTTHTGDLTIYDSRGRVVLSLDNVQTGNWIHTDLLESGIYHVQISGYSQRQRLIVIH